MTVKRVAWVPLVLIAALLTAAPSTFPGSSGRMKLTQTTVTLSANTDAKLVDAHGDRIYLCLTNIGLGRANLGVDGTATADVGQPLGAAAVAGDQGGGMCFESSAVPTNEIHAISAVDTKIVVLEGRQQ